MNPVAPTTGQRKTNLKCSISPVGKIIAIAGLCIAAIVFATPNFFSASFVKTWPDWLPKNQLSLGLDLRGGAHLLYAMDVKELRKNMLNNLRADVRKRLRDAKIGTVGTGIVANGVQTRLGQPRDMDRALVSLRELAQPLSSNLFAGTDERDLNVERVDDRFFRSSSMMRASSRRLPRRSPARSKRCAAASTSSAPASPTSRARAPIVFSCRCRGVQDTQGLKELDREDGEAELPRSAPERRAHGPSRSRRVVIIDHMRPRQALTMPACTII